MAKSSIFQIRESFRGSSGSSDGQPMRKPSGRSLPKVKEERGTFQKTGRLRSSAPVFLLHVFLLHVLWEEPERLLLSPRRRDRLPRRVARVSASRGRDDFVSWCSWYLKTTVSCRSIGRPAAVTTALREFPGIVFIYSRPFKTSQRLNVGKLSGH